MGKVISCVILVVVDIKSGSLGTCMSNESVKFVKKLASVCLESSGIAYKLRK